MKYILQEILEFLGIIILASFMFYRAFIDIGDWAAIIPAIFVIFLAILGIVGKIVVIIKNKKQNTFPESVSSKAILKTLLINIVIGILIYMHYG